MKPTTALFAALLLTACQHRSELPHLFPVPNAHLLSDAGKPVQLDEMKGSVTVYDFIFTSCAGTCPLMTATLRKVTKQIAKDTPVRFISISVDPVHDTPQQLAKYARRVRNDDRWLFVTARIRLCSK